MRIIQTVKVKHYNYAFVTPPQGTKWRVSALVAMGVSFGIKLCCPVRNEFTDEILTNSFDLSTELLIDDTTYLQFNNRSRRDKVGFYCAEEFV